MLRTWKDCVVAAAILLAVGGLAYSLLYASVEIRYEIERDRIRGPADTPLIYRVVDRPWPIKDHWTPLHWCEWVDPDYPDEEPTHGWCETAEDGGWWLDCCERPYCEPRMCPTVPRGDKRPWIIGLFDYFGVFVILGCLFGAAVAVQYIRSKLPRIITFLQRIDKRL
jgi:hypothetical protein